MNPNRRIYTDTVKLIMNKPYAIHDVPASYHAHMSIVYDSDGEIVDPVYNPQSWESYATRLPIYIMVAMFKDEVEFRFINRSDMYEVYNHLTAYFSWVKSFKSGIPVDHLQFYEDCKPFYNYLHTKCKNMYDAVRNAQHTPVSFFDKILSGGLQ